MTNDNGEQNGNESKPGWESVGEKSEPKVGEPGYKSDKTKAHEKEVAKRDDWERQEGESDVAFEAFKIYRDMGAKRSGSKVAGKLSKSLTIIRRWSSRWKWLLRCESWELEEDRIHRAGMLRSKQKMDREHIDIAREIRSFATGQLRALQAEAKKKKEDLDTVLLGHPDLLRFLTEAAKLERVAHGEPGEVIANYMSGGNNSNDSEATGPIPIPLAFQGRTAEIDALFNIAGKRASLPVTHEPSSG